MDKRLKIILACIGGVLVAGLAAAVIASKKAEYQLDSVPRGYYNPQHPDWVY